MKNAIIIYKSRKGTTKKFSENISDFLENAGLQVNVSSIEETDPYEVTRYDYIFLGCWTSGLLFFLQHPEKAWIEFAEKLTTLNSNKTIIFTTYKIRTGSMFKGMLKYLKFGESCYQIPTLKSRNGELHESEKLMLSNLIST